MARSWTWRRRTWTTDSLSTDECEERTKMKFVLFLFWFCFRDLATPHLKNQNKNENKNTLWDFSRDLNYYLYRAIHKMWNSEFFYRIRLPYEWSHKIWQSSICIHEQVFKLCKRIFIFFKTFILNTLNIIKAKIQTHSPIELHSVRSWIVSS